MTTFCPGAGNTFDAYGGTLITALACLKTERPSVVVEKDKKCFGLAVQRLFVAYEELYGFRVYNTSDPPKRLTKSELDRFGGVREEVTTDDIQGLKDASDKDYSDIEGEDYENHKLEDNLAEASRMTKLDDDNRHESHQDDLRTWAMGSSHDASTFSGCQVGSVSASPAISRSRQSCTEAVVHYGQEKEKHTSGSKRQKSLCVNVVST